MCCLYVCAFRQTTPTVDSHCHGNMLQTPLSCHHCCCYCCRCVCIAALSSAAPNLIYTQMPHATTTSQSDDGDDPFCLSSIYFNFCTSAWCKLHKICSSASKCTMKMNNYVCQLRISVCEWINVFAFSSRLFCLIKCLRGSDKNTNLISKCIDKWETLRRQLMVELIFYKKHPF